MSIAQKLVVCSSFGFVSYGCYRCYDNFKTKYETDKKFSENINNLEFKVKSFTQRGVEKCPIYNYDYSNLLKKCGLENTDYHLSDEDKSDCDSEIDYESQKLLELIT